MAEKMSLWRAGASVWGRIPRQRFPESTQGIRLAGARAGRSESESLDCSRGGRTPSSPGLQFPPWMSTEYFRLNNPITPTAPSTDLSWQMQLIVFAIAALAVISRRPDAITNPQFFAEDGAVWYADAYRLGLHSLPVPDAGYLQTFPRVVAALAALVPLMFAPFLMNVIGIVVQVLPVNILASSRYANWGSLPLRLVMGFLYLALPNSRELDVVITNAQWHLAFLACILVLAPPPATWKWRVLDVSVLLLSGLTGPFCVFLLPVAVIMWGVRRDNWRIITNLVIAACVAAQLLVLIARTPRFVPPHPSEHLPAF